jgi:hypothetical protein
MTGREMIGLLNRSTGVPFFKKALASGAIAVK